MSGPSVAVVGAGIIGCMTAWQIASRAPGTRVVLLDQGVLANGASRRSAGLHFPRGATERVRAMTAYSQDFYETLLNARPALPMRRLGMYVVAERDRESELGRIYLDRSRLTRVPDLPDGPVRVPDASGVWRGEGCLHADVAALTQELVRDLGPSAAVHEGIRVTAVEPGPSGVALRTSSGETFTADRVVLAPGPWLAGAAWRDLLAPLGARVKKVVALHVPRPAGTDDDAIIFHDDDAFLLPLPGRPQWLFSFTRHEWDIDPDTVTDGLEPADLAEGLAVLRRYLPADDARAEGGPAGRLFCDAYGPDQEPLIQALEDPRIVFAGAANGSGYRLAPAIGAAAADLLHIPFAPAPDRPRSRR